MNPARFGADDWARLERLRAAFLDADRRRGSAPTPWRDARDVELYDATLGARIGWKWRAALGELAARGFVPPPGALVDWGCGSGVAARAALAAFPDWTPARALLWDREGAALRFAADAVRAARPGLDVDCAVPGPTTEPGLLVVSHVLNELDARTLDGLVDLGLRARAVIWVESGARATSRALSAVRERLRAELAVVAPCPHAGPCGALAPGNEQEWCHHFGRPPAEAFQDAGWRAFAEHLSIDLRALPYAFVALERRAAPAEPAPGLLRVLGRPRVQKGRLALHACDAAGVRVLDLLQRDDRALFKRLGDVSRAPQLYRATVEGARLKRGAPVPEETA